ncbi:DUF1746-domain-containing protein [Xylariaceae sp. FL0255]|nr:DUF1746-domain-containing protein [Xylariaceae sp. FL0255]
MNHDSSPTLPANPLLSSHQPSDDTGDSRSANDHGSSDTHTHSLLAEAKEGLLKKLQFLVQLALNIDSLVFAELCILYYLDCSFFRLSVRWIAQTLFVSPKNEDAVLIVPNYHVSAVVIPNLLCMFLHLISPLPEAGEATRGYLHGGIMVDFVGQQPPSSRFTLLLLDSVVLALQCFMITVNMDRERIRKVVKPSRRNATSGVSVEPAVSTSQDHDAEERGVLRDAPTTDETHDIEMRPMEDDDAGDSGRHTNGEEAGLLRPSRASQVDAYEGLADVLRSGNGILGEFHIPQALRTAWHSRENTSEGAATFAIQNVGYSARRAAAAAQRRARLASAQQRQTGDH